MSDCKKTLWKNPGGKTLEGILPFQVDSQLPSLGDWLPGYGKILFYSSLHPCVSTCSYDWSSFIVPLKSLGEGQELRKAIERKAISKVKECRESPRRQVINLTEWQHPSRFLSISIKL